MNKKVINVSMCVLKYLKNRLTLQELVDLLVSIKEDINMFIKHFVKSDVYIERPNLIHKVEEEGDFANLKVEDFIGYHVAKGNDPGEELIKVYNILTKNIIPAGGFVTKNFESICFEQIPDHPIAKVYFSERRSVTITARDNMIELRM